MMRGICVGCVLMMFGSGGCGSKTDKFIGGPVPVSKPAPEQRARATPEEMEAAAKFFRLRGGIVKIDEHLSNRPIIEIDLTNATVGDLDLDSLDGLIELTVLKLKRTGITNAGLDRLKGLDGLKELTLSQTKISDAGLVKLKGLPHLEKLILDNLAITDAGLNLLAELPALRTLSLFGTQVTATGVEGLKKSNPKLDVAMDE